MIGRAWRAYHRDRRARRREETVIRLSWPEVWRLRHADGVRVGALLTMVALYGPVILDDITGNRQLAVDTLRVTFVALAIIVLALNTPRPWRRPTPKEAP